MEPRQLLAADAFEVDNIAAQAGLISTDNVAQTRSISPVGDIDFARFSISQPSRVKIETSGDTNADTKLYLYGPNDATRQAGYNDDGGEGAYSLLSEYLQPGEYHIRVNEYGDNSEIEAYELTVQATPYSELVDAYEDDDIWQRSTTLSLDGDSQEHNIHHPEDSDWYVFDLSEAARVVIDTSGPTGDPEMWLYGGGEELAYSDYDGHNSFPQIVAYLDPGRYWALIQEDGQNAAIDAYTINAQATPLSELRDAYEPDGAADDATVLPLDGQTQNHNIHRPDDVDWFTFELTEASRVVLQTAGEQGSTDMRLFSGDEQLERDTYGGSGAFSRIRAYLDPGVYHVSVQEYYQDDTIDAYTMQATATPLSELADDHEPDDERIAAPAIESGSEQTHSIHHKHDVDWMSFELAVPSKIQVDVNWHYSEAGDVRSWLFAEGDADQIIDRRGDLDYNLAAGRYQLAFTDDGLNDVIEAYTVEFEATPLSDLVPESGAVTDSNLLQIGQETIIEWTTFNRASGDTDVLDYGSTYWTDRVYLSSDTELGDDTYLTSRSGSVAPLALGESVSRSATFSLPNDSYWAGRTAYVLVDVDSSSSIPEADESNNVLVIPVHFAANLQLATPSYIAQDAAAEFRYVAFDAEHSGSVRIAVDTDDDPHNGAGHHFVATNLAGASDSANASVTVNLASLPSRAEPYYAWLQFINAKGVQTTSSRPFYIANQVETAIDEVGDAVGGNGYEIYQMDAAYFDDSLQIRVITNYNPKKDYHTGNSQGGGDLQLRIGGQNYAIAVNTHRAGASDVVAGRLYRGVTYLGGTDVSEVDTFIDTFEEEIQGHSSVAFSETQGQLGDYELVVTLDVDAVDFSFGDEITASWAMFCGNDTDETTITPVEPDPDPEPGDPDAALTDLSADRFAWSSDQASVSFEYQITSSPVDAATSAALFWSTSSTMDGAIGDAIGIETLETAVGPHGPIEITVPWEAAPEGATHLVVAIDPNEQIEELNETNNTASLTLDSGTLRGDELFEFMARQVAYTPEFWQQQLANATAERPANISVLNPITRSYVMTGYVVSEVFGPVSNTGFAAVGMTSPTGAPVLAVRGTDNWEGVYTDLDSRGVGYGQFVTHYAAIETWLNSVKSQGAPSITGHSLGGAVTQLFASRYTNLGGVLGNVVTFNSPGISEVDSRLFNKNRASRVMHYVNNGDIVSMAGDEFLEGLYRSVTFDNWFLLHKHTYPMLLDYSNLSSDTSTIRQRPEDTVVSQAAPTDWLNNPYYFHTDRDYLTALAVFWGVTKGASQFDDIPDFSKIPGWLLFRQTAEEKREQIGAALHAFRAILSPNPDLDAIEVQVPKLNINLSEYYTVKTTDLKATLFTEDGNETLRMQGKIELPQFYEVTADFVENNYIEYSQTRGWEMKGRVAADALDLSIVPGVVTIKSAWFEFDTTTIDNPELPTPPSQIACGRHDTVTPAPSDVDQSNDPPRSGLREFRGGGVITTPWGMDLIVGLGFYEGQFNYIGVGADNLQRRVFTTPLFLQCVAGQVDHLVDPKPPSLTPQAGFTIGPKIPINLPSWLGGPREVSLGTVNLQATVTPDNMTGAGNFDFLEGLARGSGQLTLDWTKGYVRGAGQLAFWDEIVRMNARFRIDSDLNLGFMGQATVQLPNIPYSPIKNLTLGSGMAAMRYTHDGNYANDYIAFWGVLNPSWWSGPFNVGVKVQFNGDWDWIGDVSDLEELPPVSENSIANIAANTIAGSQVEKRFQVREGSERLMLYVGTDADDVEFEIIDPLGDTYTQASLSSHANMALIDEFTSESVRTVGVTDPQAGVWTLKASSQNSQAELHAGAASDADLTNFNFTGVESDGSTATISYAATDADSDAEISFYYDDDSEGGDGFLIGQATEADGAGVQQWNLDDVEAGDYSVYAVIDDGQHAPQIVYSSEIVTVTGDPPRSWHNSRNPFDINDDSRVTIQDALTVIDALRGQQGLLPDPSSVDQENWKYVDASNDGRLSVLDAFLVIDAVRDSFQSGEGEGERTVDSSLRLSQQMAAPIVASREAGSTPRGFRTQSLAQSSLNSQLAVRGQTDEAEAIDAYFSVADSTAANLTDEMDDLLDSILSQFPWARGD